MKNNTHSLYIILVRKKVHQKRGRSTSQWIFSHLFKNKYINNYGNICIKIKEAKLSFKWGYDVSTLVSI